MTSSDTQTYDIGCSTSAQQSDHENGNAPHMSTDSGPIDQEHNNATVIARLLNKNPLVIEVLDMEPWSNFVEDNLTVRNLNINNKYVSELDKLKFNDIFEAKQYLYTTDAGIEFGLGIGIYDIKPQPTPRFYHEVFHNFRPQIEAAYY